MSVAVDRRWDLYKVLAEPQRLRLLALSAVEELSVGELGELLGESQSNVSRQLSPLRRLGLLSERKQGTRVFVRLAEAVGADAVVGDALGQGRELCRADGVLDRVADVVARRDAVGREFFSRGHGDGPGQGARVEGFPGELPAYLFACAQLLQRRRLAVDVGTGDGRLLEVLAPLFERVIGIDREPAQLARAGERLKRRGYHNVDLVAADALEPQALGAACEPGQADVVFASRILHHAPQPGRMLKALATLMAADGVLLLLDYVAHQDERMSDQQADLWLGFAASDLRNLAQRAGLSETRVAAVPPSFCGRGPDAHVPWQLLFARRTAAARGDASPITGTTPTGDDNG